MKTLKIFLVGLLAITLLTACSCKHEWIEATCTEAKTCQKCGETEGEPAGHDWAVATCTEPKTCKSCGETEGQSLGHTAGTSTLSSVDKVEGTENYQTKCTSCGKVMDTNKKSIETFIDGDEFDISPSDLADRFENAFARMTTNKIQSQLTSNDDGDLAIVLGDTTNKVTLAAVTMLSPDTGKSMKYSDRYTEGIKGIVSMVYDDDYAAQFSIALVLSMDPNISFDDAKLTCERAIGDNYSKNGISYLLTQYGGSYVMFADVD